LRLDDDVFRSLVAGVALKAAQFYTALNAVAAHDADDRIIYNTSTGDLYYDADGNVTGFVAIQFASLTGHPTLTASDFVIVA